MDTTQTLSSSVSVNGRALRLPACASACASACAYTQTGTRRQVHADRRQANREDVIPVPARLQGLLPPDHLACRVWELVEQLDLSEFYADIEVAEGTPGAPATDPKIPVAVWIYATMQGETSARQIETLCVEHLAYIWLCGGVTMNYHSLSDFRVRHAEALDRLLTQTVQRLAEAGLVEFEAHAQDGMRVRASAACLRAYTHRQGAASFHRQATLEKALARATAEQETVRQSETGETSSRTARERAAQERAANERVARLEAALTELPCLWQTGCRASRQTGGRTRGSAGVQHRPVCRQAGAEARVMKMADGGFRPAYNWEFAVDTARLVITGVEVVNTGSDKAQAKPMLDQVQARCGCLPEDWLMDGGFVTLAAIETAQAKGVRVLAPVPEPKDETRDRYAPLPGDTPAVAAWRERMGTAEAKQTYKLRAATVECVNAQARSSNGVYQVRVRGRAKVRCVALWVAIAHNLRIWMRHLLQPLTMSVRVPAVAVG